MNLLSRRRAFGLVVITLGLVGQAGCGGSDVMVATKTSLRGKVSVNRKPVFTGLVTAHQNGTKIASTNINPDGTFEFSNIAAGDYQLTITATDTDTPYGKGVKLNSKYSDPASSGLIVSVAGKDDSPRDFALDAAK